MILDLVGASHFQGNIDCLTIEGRLLLVGMPGGSEAKINLGQVRVCLCCPSGRGWDQAADRYQRTGYFCKYPEGCAGPYCWEVAFVLAALKQRLRKSGAHYPGSCMSCSVRHKLPVQQPSGVCRC